MAATGTIANFWNPVGWALGIIAALGGIAVLIAGANQAAANEATKEESEALKVLANEARKDKYAGGLTEKDIKEILGDNWSDGLVDSLANNAKETDKLVQEMNNGQVPVGTQTQTAQNIPTQQPVQQSQMQQAPTFTGAVQMQDDNGLTNCMVADTKKDDSKLKLGPTVGAAVGLAAPFVCNKFKLGKFLTKDLMIKAPVMTVGGLCAGGIAEGLGESAKKLEANNAEDKAVAQMMDVRA
jgi:hypothetical protein